MLLHDILGADVVVMFTGNIVVVDELCGSVELTTTIDELSGAVVNNRYDDGVDMIRCPVDINVVVVNIADCVYTGVLNGSIDTLLTGGNELKREVLIVEVINTVDVTAVCKETSFVVAIDPLISALDFIELVMIDIFVDVANSSIEFVVDKLAMCFTLDFVDTISVILSVVCDERSFVVYIDSCKSMVVVIGVDKIDILTDLVTSCPELGDTVAVCLADVKEVDIDKCVLYIDEL